MIITAQGFLSRRCPVDFDNPGGQRRGTQTRPAICFNYSVPKKCVIKGFLIDLDGTVVEGDHLIPEVASTLAWLKQAGIPYRFITNTTSKPRQAIVEKLQRLGLTVAADEIFTAPAVGRDYLLQQNLTRCYPLIKASLQEDLKGIALVEESPQAVLVGDIGDELTYAKLNQAFRFLLDGAAFVALARNRYFRGNDGLCLDVGSIVAALEYATQREALLIGKPAREFFLLAGQSLGTPQETIAVIGDDIEADVGGGKEAGSVGILVRTGKFRPEQLAKTKVSPDAVLDSLASLRGWWEDNRCGG
ncbi:MAG: TIGR01458 family HAD-type hydrolase [Methylacidiphilales bacterium]|nr:TIGR01458 family HAD-type hydrolase [Candidatus Methylacidiphilales bacterium]